MVDRYIYVTGDVLAFLIHQCWPFLEGGMLIAIDRLLSDSSKICSNRIL